MSKKSASTLPCDVCRGQCCKHVAMEIDTPTCKQDYDNIRWFLVHQNVQVYVEPDKSWGIEFITPCSRLTRDNLCSDYDNRPRLCRQYPGKDTECEFVSEEKHYKKLFTTAEEFESWLDKKKIKWRFKK